MRRCRPLHGRYLRTTFVEEIRYKVYGCAACIAAGSALSELVDGKHLSRRPASRRRTSKTPWAGRFPLGKEHALTLVLDALHKAFEDHWNRTAGEMLLDDGGTRR